MERTGSWRVVKDFRIGAGDQVAVYGERVAPEVKSVNPALHLDGCK